MNRYDAFLSLLKQNPSFSKQEPQETVVYSYNKAFFLIRPEGLR